MTRSRSSLTLRLALAGALAVAAPLALSGCSLINNAISGGVDQVVEGATGGGVDLPGTSIPDDFPADVPLPDGDVTYGAGISDDENQVWSVGIKVSGADAYGDITATLTDAGFEKQFEAESGDGATGSYTKGDLSVLVAVAKDSDDWIATFTVTQPKK